MKVNILRSTVADGQHFAAGAKGVEVSDKDARFLIALKKAEPAAEKQAKETAEPARKKTGRGKKQEDGAENRVVDPEETETR